MDLRVASRGQMRQEGSNKLRSELFASKQEKRDGKQSVSSASLLRPAALGPTNEAAGFRQI